MAPRSAYGFQNNLGLTQHMCFHKTWDLVCAAPPWVTMSVSHKFTGSVEVTGLSWASVSPSAWWERHHSILPCFMLCYMDQDAALLGPAEWAPVEWEENRMLSWEPVRTMSWSSLNVGAFASSKILVSCTPKWGTIVLWVKEMTKEQGHCLFPFFNSLFHPVPSPFVQ